MPKRQRQDTHGLEQMQGYQATIANQGDLIWKPDVNTTADLPANGNEIGDTRLVRSSGYAYQYTANGWKKIAGSGGGGGGTASWGDIEGDIADQTDLQNALNSKVSTNNLKTINSQSIVGTGNIEIDGIAKSATAPANPQQGDVYYNTTDNVIYSYDGEQWNAVGGSGTEFDPNGYYPGLHSGLADNLYTSDNIIDISSWNFRTTAGSESVPSSGTASLNNIKGKTVRTVARTECIITPTATDGIFITGIDKYRTLYSTNNTTGTYTFTLTSGAWDTDPSTYGLTVSLQQAEFSIENASWSDTGETFKSFVSTARGTFTLSYADSEWTLTNGTDTWNNVDPTSDLGMMYAHITDTIYVRYYDVCTDGSITLDFTAEVRGTLVSSAPRYLQATGVNQFQSQYLLQNVEISNGEIVSGSHYIAICPAYGGVTNGYMGYCPDGYIVNCGWVDGLNTQIDIGTSVNTTGNTVTSTECSMPNANTGWFLVEVSTSVDDTQLSIHPKWSGQQDANTDAYTTSTVTLPTEDTDNNPLPAVMPSVGSVADELNGQTQTYTQRIEVVSFSYSELYQTHEDGLTFDYDENYIYVVLEIPETYTVSFDNTYTANDYGTEAILDENNALNPVLTENNTSYGSNLVDKLRTGVVTKEEYPQVITQGQYDALPASKNTDGIIRFIYTVE